MISRYETVYTAVASIYHDIQKLERSEMGKLGLRGPQAQCMLVMYRYPEGLTAAQLCDICEKDKSAISRILAELEQAGMVTRESRNGTRYRASVRLTPRGVQVAQQVSEKARTVVEQAGQGLTDLQREVFYPVLAMLSENINRICREGIRESRNPAGNEKEYKYGY